jgi:hypothetical protein
VTNKAIIRFPVAESDLGAVVDDDGLTAKLLAVHGTNDARQRTCRVLGRGLARRFRAEPFTYRILSVACSWASDEFCTALVEVEYGDACCKSWTWLLVKACGLDGVPHPFEWVEMDHEDATLLRRALTRMATIEQGDEAPHS